MREITVETKKYVAKDGKEFADKDRCGYYEKQMKALYDNYKNGEIMTFDFGVKDEYFYVVFADGIESERHHEDNLNMPYALDLIVNEAIYAHKEKTNFKYKRYMTEDELNTIKLYGNKESEQL